jgi:hypothetical protein
MSRPTTAGAACQEALDARLADSRGGSGDQGDLAGEGGALPPLRSFACSRSQYSTSKMSLAGKAFQPPSFSARWMICIVCS